MWVTPCELETGWPVLLCIFVCISAWEIVNGWRHHSSICLKVLEHGPCVSSCVLAVPSVRIMYAARVHAFSDTLACLCFMCRLCPREATRIHVKRECRRVWLWCERIGLLIWRCVWRRYCSDGGKRQPGEGIPYQDYLFLDIPLKMGMAFPVSILHNSLF